MLTVKFLSMEFSDIQIYFYGSMLSEGDAIIKKIALAS